jgi:hypothetical protein
LRDLLSCAAALPAFEPPDLPAPKNLFCAPVQTHHLHPALSAKIFNFFFSEIVITFALSRLDQRGASRSSRTLRRDAVGVSMLQRGFHADERR